MHVNGNRKNKKKNWKDSKNRSSNQNSSSSQSSQHAPKKAKNNDNCHFCKKSGHIQKDCVKRREWFEKKGKPLAFVCFESNFIEPPSNTWWIDSGSNVHVSNSMQGYLTTRNISPNEAYLYMGNRMKAPVEAIGNFRLVLSTGFHLDLENTLYVPTVSRNLISLSKLDLDGFSSYTGDGCFKLFKNNELLGFGILVNGLYQITLDNSFSESLNMTLHPKMGLKRTRTSESSSFVWNKRLSHISEERVNLLVK